jgi:cytochrome c-type biogenesis protein
MSTGLSLAAFSGGVAAFFAPCAFPLLPGYIGYYLSEQDGTETPIAGIFARAAAAVVGVSLVFLILALVVTTIGRALINQLMYAEVIIGILLTVVGVMIVTEKIPRWHVQLPSRSTTVLGFALFGAGYAVAATGCMVGVFAAIMIEAARQNAITSILVVCGFATGLSVPLFASTLIVGIGYDSVLEYVPSRSHCIQRLAGGLILIAGILQTYRAIAAVG